MYSMKLCISTTDGRHDITGAYPVMRITGNTRKQLFVNGIRAFLDLRASDSIKAQIKAKTFPAFSRWEFLLSNSAKPGRQMGEKEYWIRRHDNNWEILEYNKDWRGSIRDTIYTHIYTMPNAKVRHPSAEDFMMVVKK